MLKHLPQQTAIPKRIILLTALVLAFGMLSLPYDSAYSQNKYTLGTLLHSTHDEAILQAFDLMQNNRAEGALDIIVKRRTRVFFKNLREISKQVKNYDALSWISPQGEWVIFVNKKHKNAPPEALAAVIAHEAIHNDPQNSLKEEIVAWHHEARVWQDFKKQNPELATLDPENYPLVERLNTIEAAYSNGTLTELVSENQGYTNLPESSPGFSDTEHALNNPAFDPYHPLASGAHAASMPKTSQKLTN